MLKQWLSLSRQHALISARCILLNLFYLFPRYWRLITFASSFFLRFSLKIIFAFPENKSLLETIDVLKREVATKQGALQIARSNLELTSKQLRGLEKDRTKVRKLAQNSPRHGGVLCAFEIFPRPDKTQRSNTRRVKSCKTRDYNYIYFGHN